MRILSHLTSSSSDSDSGRTRTNCIAVDTGILSIFTLFLLYWFRFYFTSNPIPSVDLPSFIAGVESLSTQILHGRLSFYEHESFIGWVPFLLYGVVPSACVVPLAWLLTLISSEPARLATHITLVFGMALFPWSFYYACKAIAREAVGESIQIRSIKALLAVSVCTYSFWFLNHDRQWYGIGAAAPMNIGLFSQLFAWHFMLLYFGSLIRIVSRDRFTRRDVVVFVLSLGLLIPTHLLSAVYSLFIGGLCFLWYAHSRKIFFKLHCLGIGVAAFWFFPFLAFVGDIAPLDMHRPKGDFLELFFRYPAWGALKTVQTWMTTRSIDLFNPIYLVNIGSLILLFSHQRIARSLVIRPFFFFILCSLIFFSSGFVATSLQIGLHYYRFMAYVFLFTTVLFSVVPIVCFADRMSTLYQKVPLLFLTLLLTCFFCTLGLPHYERTMISDHAQKEYLTDQEQIVAYFANQSNKGRVYVEYLTDYDTFAPLSAHYLSSRLPKESGFEVLPNSHLQEAPSYRMIAASAKLLKAKTYNVPLLFTDDSDLSDKALIEQFQEFGITHIVAGTKDFRKKLRRYTESEMKIGVYSIFTLSKEPLTSIQEVSERTIVGYRDTIGSAPFRYIQYFFYSRQFLYRNFELIDLTGIDSVPEQVGLLLENVEINSNEIAQDKNFDQIRINFVDNYRLEHYSPHYSHNKELDLYKKIERYLAYSAKIVERLKPFKVTAVSSKLDSQRYTVEWKSAGQELHLFGLTPGVFYQVNYTYFPLWRTRSASLFRGMGERIYLIPQAETVVLTFSRWNSASCWLGLLVSLFSIVFLLTPYSSRFLRYDRPRE